MCEVNSRDPFYEKPQTGFPFHAESCPFQNDKGETLSSRAILPRANAQGVAAGCPIKGELHADPIQPQLPCDGSWRGYRRGSAGPAGAQATVCRRTPQDPESRLQRSHARAGHAVECTSLFVYAGPPPSCGCLGLTGIFKSRKQEALFGLFRNCLILWALKLAYDYYFPRTLVTSDAKLPSAPTTPD